MRIVMVVIMPEIGFCSNVFAGSALFWTMY